MNIPPNKAALAEGFNVSRWALEHPALTRYLMVVLMLMGFAAYFQLGQDEDPPFTFRIMVVQAFWPGATAQQMADQVTDKIEKTLQEVNHADKIRSYTKPGESLTLFQLKDNTPPKDVPDAFYQVRKKINDMRSTLPQGVLGPVFNDDFGDVYGSIYALSADGFSREELREHADRVRQALLQVKDVAKVEIFGIQPEKLFIEISQKRLAQLGLDFSQVIGQIGAQNAVEGAGVLNAGSANFQIRVQGQFTTPQALADVPIRAVNPQTGAASQMRLGDIADIRREYVDPPTTMVRHNGKEVLALGVSMAKGGDIIAMGKALGVAMKGVERDLPAGIHIEQVQDQPKAVSTSVGEFVHVLIEAVVIVLAVSFISLGLHTKPLRIDIWPGLVVAITIPLVLAITFVAMFYWGVGLHKISLGSLIIALGLLVDDAIIAVEMMVRKLEEGYDKMHAATFAYDVTAMPMLTGTLITAVGFLPIGLAKSTVGEYTFAIFAVTAASLLISWGVSVYFVPYLGALLLKGKHAAAGEVHELFDTPFYNRFRGLVRWCVENRWKTIGITLLVFVLGLFGMTRVQQQFFPDSSRPEVLVDLWLPEGSTIQETEALAKRFEARLLKEQGIATVTTWMGAGVPRFYLPLDQIFPQSNVMQSILLSKGLVEREELRKRLPALLAEEFPEARGRVKLLPNGPPVPYPVQFRVMGADPKVVRNWADKAKDILRASPNMRGVNDNWNENVKVLRLNVDQDKARALGVSSQSLAQSARTLLSGSVVGQYREADKLIDIVLRQPLDERAVITDIASAYVPTSSGRAIPLTQIAKVDFDWEPGVMWREGRNYAVTVQGDVVEGLQGATVTQEVWPRLDELQKQMPTGYSIQIAGAVEESSKGQGSIAAGMPVMLFITFTLLMLQLQSFSRAMLVFLTGPLGIAGVAMALLALNRPFGFVALLGVIALMGMIMRNSVILIDQIEQDRARGVPDWSAIVESAVRRFRPIVLTAAAAVLAMIPLSRSVFWGPMAVAIMGGLIVATVLTLLALPAMYAAWFRVVRPEEEEHSRLHSELPTEIGDPS
ncbi:efflux RND transporter permease subunit [Pelomonas aquatica]|jgi:multidrug efflux pump|uniref:Efflux RND transporter permease subunit n=1 Tax=Pelomonas aquatica TaxID=431058 RepID=A0A9X4LG05_9BURK|nr:efflux RND transporter permease subunit [Pelomonas aquatica]MCY4755490.1 efflux RND transporter permease subunit [Pelomonas aquatica]MDG0862296.1 efflux RND transporter permease subunit [Pelomonas aquatica]